jgi:hypothetical protein
MKLGTEHKLSDRYICYFILLFYALNDQFHFHISKTNDIQVSILICGSTY